MVKSLLTTKAKLTSVPLYMQVRDHFLLLIASGEWAVDRAIESEVELARAMGVSTGTVRKALDALEADGLVARRQAAAHSFPIRRHPSCRFATATSEAVTGSA